MGLLGDKGYEILVCDLTHNKLRVPVVRVVIPGLQPIILMGKGTHFSGCLSDPNARVSNHLIQNKSN